MSNSTLSWEDVANQPKKQTKTDDLVFLNAKNLPQTFSPGNQLLPFEVVYDQVIGKNRLPLPGEKSKKQYLFYGLHLNEKGEKVIKIYCCGEQTKDGIATTIKTFRDSAKQFDEKVDPKTLTTFVKVTSSGTGLNTEYKVEPFKGSNKTILVSVWEKLTEYVNKLPTLEEMKNRLTGTNKKDKNENNGLNTLNEQAADNVIEI